MQITFTSFKTTNGNILFSSNTSVLNKYIISEEGLNTALDIASHQGQKDVWEMLSHKIMYISYAKDYENKKDYATFKVFIVKRSNGEIELWSNKYITIDKEVVVFTTLDEAKSLTEKHQKYEEYEGLVAFRDYLSAMLDEVTEEIIDLKTQF